MLPNDRTLLQHMLRYARLGQSLIAEVGGENQEECFLLNEALVLAVTHSLQIIGEAASKVSLTERLKHPHLEWAPIISLRNRIVHDYFGIDNGIIWQIASTELDPLIAQLEEILSGP
jgi:uncharacterized protein with HEPN domain